MRKRVWFIGALVLCAIAVAGWCYVYWCRAIVVDQGINGLAPEQVIAKYGRPDGNDIFIVSDTMLEYRYGLIDLYPQYRDSSIEIMEMLWRDSSRTFAVWFRWNADEWESVENLRWANRVQF